MVAPLDFPSEGVVLLTSDGALAEAMLKRGKVVMTYHLKLQGLVGEPFEPAHEREEFIDPHAGVEGHVLGDVADPTTRLQPRSAKMRRVSAGSRASSGNSGCIRSKTVTGPAR